MCLSYKDFFGWSFCILHLGFSIVTKIMAIIAQNKDPFSILPEGFQNMNQVPIVNFNNTKETFIIDIYKGTIKGYEKNHNIYRGDCGSKKKCDKYYAATPPVNITKWKGIEFTSSLDPYYSYSNLLKLSVTSNEKCPSNKKQCGILDTMNNKMCIDKKKECPINLIIRTYTPEPPSEYPYNFRNITFSDGTYFFFTNEAIDKPIIANLKISDEDVCINPNEYSSHYIPYPLDYYAYYGCNTIINSTQYNLNYKYLDSMNKFSLYEDNRNMLSSIETDDYKEQLKIQTISLYYSSFIGYNKQCIQNFNIDVSSYSIYHSRLRAVNNIFKAVDIITFIIIFIEIIEIVALIKYQGIESIKTLMIYNIFPAIFSLSFLILSTVNFVFLQNLNYDNPCSDNYTTLIFQYFNERKKKIKAYTLVILICHSVYLFLFLMLGLGALLYKFKREFDDRRRIYRRYRGY